MGLFSRQPDDEDRARAVAASTPRAITASAQRMRLNDKDEIDRFKQRKSADSWQADAWEYFDAIGEIKYSGNLIGAVLSRVRLYPGYNVNPDQAPSHVGAAAGHATVDIPPEFVNDCDRVLQRLQTANGGISGILNRAGINIWVAGECYLVQTPEKPGSGIPERWDIKSVDELVVNPSATGGSPGQPKSVLSIKSTRNAKLTKADELPPDAFAGRIWRSHPRYSDEADSSLRAVRDLCDELLLLNRSARATIRSRLNAGAMYLPDGLSLAADADEDDQLDPNTAEVMADPPEEEDPFEQELIDAMITPISDEESVAAVVPLIIRGPADLADKIKQFKFERSFDPEMVTRAATILDRIMHGLDIPKDVISGLANVKYSNALQIDESLYKCVPVDTEVLTRDGWVTYDKLRVGDEIYTLNVQTQLAEWQPATAINIYDVVDEPMRRVSTRSHASLSTMNHRWPVYRNGSIIWRTSETVRRGDQVVVAAPSADLPVDAKYTDEFVELVAWFYTEGSISHDRVKRASKLIDHDIWNKFLDEKLAEHDLTDAQFTAQSGHGMHYVRRGIGYKWSEGRERLAKALAVDVDVINQHWKSALARRFGCIVQSHTANPEKVIRIRRVFQTLFGGQTESLAVRYPAWNEKQHGTGTYFGFNDELCQLLETVCKGFDKIVDLRFIQELTQAQLELFIHVSLIADGDSVRSIGQKVPERLSALELAAVLAGRPVRQRYAKTPSIVIKSAYPYADLVPRPNAASIEQYTGKIWCPTTPNHTWFARYNEQMFFTGNSHVEPLILLICDALTEVYYRPALLAMGHMPETVQKALIWYDPSDILTHPNKAQSANDGYDRRALSGRAWRKAHGYAETDAPTNEELAFRILVERAVPPPQLVTQLFQMFIPTLMEQANANGLGADNAAGPLAPGAQDILEGQPEQPNDNGAPPAQPGANPATQPPAPPTPPTPATPLPVSPNPSVPTSNGMRS